MNELDNLKCSIFSLTVLKKLRRAGKKLNKKELLSTNLATKYGYCTQHHYITNTQSCK